MKNLSAIFLFLTVSTSLYAECIVHQLPRPYGDIMVKEKFFTDDFSLKSRDKDFGEVEKKGDSYTWFNSEGVEIASASRTLIEKKYVSTTAFYGIENYKYVFSIEVVDCEGKVIATMTQNGIGARYGIGECHIRNYLINDSEGRVFYINKANEYDCRSGGADLVMTGNRLVATIHYPPRPPLLSSRLPRRKSPKRVLSLHGIENTDHRLMILLAAIDLDSSFYKFSWEEEIPRN